MFVILFLGIWDMCSLNYWDMGYCIVILGIFRDIFGYVGIRDICHFIFWDMGYVFSELLGYEILHCHFGYF
jgi:hypothetical protein